MRQLCLLVFRLFMTVIILVGCNEIAAAEKRVALVIGNAAYGSVGALKNPRHDAEDMAVRLERHGFEVVRGFDLVIAGVPSKLQEFATKLKDAEVALLF
jgi:uncharacterized caspase-like protein